MEVQAVSWVASARLPEQAVPPGYRVVITQDCPHLSGALLAACQALGAAASRFGESDETQADMVIITSGFSGGGLTDRHWTALHRACRAQSRTRKIVFLQPLLSDNGLDGLALTLAREWPAQSVSCLSVAQEVIGEPRQLAQTILGAAPGSWQLLADGRLAVRNEQAWTPRSAQPRARKPGLWLVTGGARGVTAACAVALARRTGDQFLLAGRSRIAPWPENIPLTTDIRAVRAALACAAEISGERRDLKSIDQQARAALAGAEIRQTLDSLSDAGVTAGYMPLDVSDRAAVMTAISKLQVRHGPIIGLVHGAGVIADRLALEKKENELRRVFAPKAQGLMNLLDVIDPDRLEHLGLFSSASAHFGNRGQSDYAMANAVLINCGRRLARDYPKLDVKIFDWGPWAGGMVDAALATHFESRGAALIGLDEGAGIFADIMTAGDKSVVEILIGSEWSQA